MIWVVDATDRLRIEDCREELHGLLQEEVRVLVAVLSRVLVTNPQKSVFPGQACWCLPTRPMLLGAWAAMKC